MTNRPRAIGTAAETAVVKVLRANGFGQAERRPLHGAQDWGDIYGTPGIAWEVKGGEAGKAAHGRPTLLASFLAQAEAERINSSSDIGILVLARKGFPRADQWWAVVQLGQFLEIGTGDSVHFLDTVRSVPSLAERAIHLSTPIWLELGDLVRALRITGYGDPLPETYGHRIDTLDVNSGVL
jgi:hypothetical protein